MFATRRGVVKLNKCNDMRVDHPKIDLPFYLLCIRTKTYLPPQLLVYLPLNVSMGVHRVTDLEKFPVRVSRDEAPVCMGVHRVTDLEKFPVRVSRDEAPTPLPLFGLVI